MTGLLHSAGLQNRKKDLPLNTTSCQQYTWALRSVCSLFYDFSSLLYPLTARGEGSRREWFQQAPTDLREVAASWRWLRSGSPGRWWRPRWPRRLPACGSWSALPSSWCAGSARWGTAPCNPPGVSSGVLCEKETRWDTATTNPLKMLFCLYQKEMDLEVWPQQVTNAVMGKRKSKFF